jgi:hypothetical protein
MSFRTCVTSLSPEAPLYPVFTLEQAFLNHEICSERMPGSYQNAEDIAADIHLISGVRCQNNECAQSMALSDVA